MMMVDWSCWTKIGCSKTRCYNLARTVVVLPFSVLPRTEHRYLLLDVLVEGAGFALRPFLLWPLGLALALDGASRCWLDGPEEALGKFSGIGKLRQGYDHVACKSLNLPSRKGHSLNCG